MEPAAQPSASPPDAPARTTTRVGLALVVAVYLVYCSFGIAHPLLWGHYGHHTAEYTMRVRMTMRFHLVTPATAAGYELPGINTYYLHHPIGYHHLLLPFMLVFGDKPWVAAAVPALSGLLVLLALYRLARRHWSPPQALLAVAVYVALPVLCSFSILTDPMLPTMACSLGLVYFFLEYLKKPTLRSLMLACLLIVVGGLLMWELYFQSFFHGLFAIARLATRAGRAQRLVRTSDAAAKPGRLLGRIPAPLLWLVATGVSAILTMAFHLWFVWSRGMWEDFTVSYRIRHAADPLWVLGRHRTWLEVLYGWPPLVIGIVWLILFFIRAGRRRARARDQAVIIFFIINSFYIYLFAQGSSIHLYRVFFFSSFFALASMDLAAALHCVLARLGARRPDSRVLKRLPGVVTGLAIVVYFALELPHAYANLIESREMMGTHTHPGYSADYHKQRFTMEVAQRTGSADYVFTHSNIPHRVEFLYTLDRSGMKLPGLAALPPLLKKHPRAVLLIDAYPAPPERTLLVELLRHHPALIFDRYMMVDLRENTPGLREYMFVEETPSLGWRWWVSHRYPPLRAVETATVQGACWRAEAGIDVAVLHELAPPPWHATDQLLCYHNDLIARGQSDRAAAFRRMLATRLDPRPRMFGARLRVLGLRNLDRNGTEVWLQSEPATPSQRQPAHPPPSQLRWRLEPLTPDRVIEGEIAPPAATAADLWDLPAGYLYAPRISWALSPGDYRLALELAARPLPPPVAPSKPAAATSKGTPALSPPSASLANAQPPPPPLARAALGTVHIADLTPKQGKDRRAR